ncbi:SRPBCC family protein [Glycomyces sp. A-F 0318]|uniref:SRPBCC family protein n=1 Tax=Glycomyces amatae TaxID=2881355 RepID=UPI001E58317F|nr:SRPBCC family protein [Glycomyces amatae]MCD0446895.1 SRPBCC family protein [Glycomyces amatae]
MTRIDKASRDIAVPTERAYAALVDPDALIQWLPPEGMSGYFEWFDAGPGGSYRLVLTYAEGTGGKSTADSDVVDARFVGLDPGERVVQEIDFVSDDPDFTGTMTMNWSVAPVGDGSRVEITATDVPVGITPEDHAAGLASSLANLAAYLER